MEQITVENKVYQIIDGEIKKGDLMLVNNPHPKSSLKNIIRTCAGSEKMSSGETGYYWFDVTNKKSGLGNYSRTFPKSMINRVVEKVELKESNTSTSFEDYYQKQLDKLDLSSEYAPGVVVTDGAGNKTKNMSINEESAKVLKKWLEENFNV